MHAINDLAIRSPILFHLNVAFFVFQSSLSLYPLKDFLVDKILLKIWAVLVYRSYIISLLYLRLWIPRRHSISY